MAQRAAREVQVEMGKGPGCWQGVREDPALAPPPAQQSRAVSAWPSVLHSLFCWGISLGGLVGGEGSCFAPPEECRLEVH